MWITTLVNKLFQLLKNVGSAHKKKLILGAILLLGFSIAKRKIKVHHIIQIVMFFIKFWGNVLSMLPLPKYRGYRDRVTTFKYQKEYSIQQVQDLMNINKILIKVKNKQAGSLNELKFSILSGTIFQFVVYNAQTFYNTVLHKYYEDFVELSAEQKFETVIKKIKQKFKQNLEGVKKMIQTTLHSLINSIELTELFDLVSLEKLFKKLVYKIFEETQNIKSKVQKSFAFQQKIKEYKIAENYFSSTLEYIEQEKPNPVSKTISILFKPITLLWSGLNSMLQVPQEQIAEQRYFCNQFIYLLPLKKYRNQENWPNKQSYYLNELVIEQIGYFFNSTNFCTFLKLRADHHLLVFNNRLNIYFNKKARCQKKKLLDLLPVFHKIIKQQMIDIDRKQQLYNRELMSAFRQIKLQIKGNLLDLRLRNKILLEIYEANELSYIQRDMQIKYFNERQNIIIKPKIKNKKQYEQRNEIKEFLQNYDRADDEKAPQQYISKIKNALLREQ